MKMLLKSTKPVLRTHVHKFGLLKKIRVKKKKNNNKERKGTCINQYHIHEDTYDTK